MKALILSAVLGLGTLGTLLASAAPAQAGPLVWFLVARRVAWGPPYADRVYVPAPGYYYYGPPPAPPVRYSTSADEQVSDTDRYQYYWANGRHMCFDRQTGEYWYQDPANPRYWYKWQ